MPRALRLLFLVAATLMTLAPQAWGEAVTIDIYGPGQNKMNMALAQPLGPDGATAPAPAAELQKLIRENLQILPFLDLIAPESIIGGDKLAGVTLEDVDFKRFQLVGADLLLTSGWNPEGTAVELRVLQVFTKRQLVGKSYSGLTARQLPEVADRFCAAFMEALTGHGEFFRSTLALVKKVGENKNVYTVRPTGRDLRPITNLKGYCLSPTWSKDGRYIAFTYIDDRKHSLGVADLDTGKVTTQAYKGRSVISPAFTAGNKIAVSMSEGENPNIVLLDANLKIERTLIKSNSIDVSPSFDQSGSTLAFVSDRFGGPQIFIAAGGGANRVTYEGSYNTDPSLSPTGDKVVFTRRTPQGYRIFAMDLTSGKERQISFGPGNDEQPAFAPDGYFVAFTSTRNGPKQIYLTTRHGDPAVRIPTGGDGSFPAWGLRE